ncbi:MAG: hypothetical protein ACFFB4_03185 [Promethearchaeota archaeon]
MEPITKFIDNITKYSTISIIGLAKNVSKTTTLNHLIKNLKEYKLGLTSIGRDGEEYDVITNLPKPRIYVEEGTYFATAQQSLENSDIKFEVIKNTGISTPMGKVLILRAQSSGLIELAGPSISTQLPPICKELKSLGCEIILIDGAFDRRTYATPLISEATIISTGASVSEDMKKVVDLTIFTLELLTLQNETNHEILGLAKKIFEDNNVGFINKDNTVKKLELPTALDAAEEIRENLDENSKYVLIKGALTNKLLGDLMRITNKYKNLTILVEDGTKLFLSKNIFNKFHKKGGFIKVLNPIKVIAITINPTSPDGLNFNKEKFLKLLEEKVKVPVYDLGPS